MRMVNTINSTLTTDIDSDRIHYNLSNSQLIEASLANKEGILTEQGALQAYTGKFTGRSPKDKYIVEESSVKEDIEWGKVNQPISETTFKRLYNKAVSYMSDRELYVFDGSAGADPEHSISLRVINEFAWHNLFARQLFISSSEAGEENHDFTVISLPGLKADPMTDGTNSEAFVIISFEKKVVLIGGTAYAGEMKKSIFSILNYSLPFQDVFPMHCSANIGEREDDVALFFGLSGTGKTTLSADSSRKLIGDDEHGWSDKGVFNFEGGCYAKCIGLSRQQEPQIWDAIRYGSVLENVTVDPNTRELDFHDTTCTENTRAAYTIENISNAVIPSVAGHPKTILFLTADAFGVLPPIAKLNKEQAMYHFLSGYTSKLAGTERGISKPEATFSACFGEPFLPLRPDVYAEMLGSKMDDHDVRVYLVNTGWTGGAYGTGKRIKLAYTRSMVNAAITGEIEQAAVRTDPVFGLAVPESIPGVSKEILNPRNTWENHKEYDEKARDLARRFHQNFSKFSQVSEEVKLAGPKVF